MPDNIPIEVPCTLVLGDCSFEVEARVVYNRIGTTVAIESVTINGSDITLSEEQYLQLSEELTYLFDEEGN